MRKKIILIILLLTISSIPLISLVKPGIPDGHDWPDHVARIANFSASLKEGIVVPRWAGNLNWGYGHPILMFLYPLPSYIASFFHEIGLSLENSTKAVFAVSYVLSIFSMYIFASSVWGIGAGFLASVLYGYAPYRFVDLYVRGALGEHVAFIFPPLIMYFIFNIAKKIDDKKLFLHEAGLSVSLALFILSHNAISILFMPIFLLFSLYLFSTQENKNKFAIRIILFTVLGFGLSGFFWIPAFLEGKYTLRDIVTDNDFSSRFVNIRDFFYSKWRYGGTDELTKQIGFAHWAGIIIAFLLLITKKVKKKRTLFIGGLIVFTFSLFFMTDYSSMVWQNISILQKFQFPWRFLSVTVFISSIISALSINWIFEKFLSKKTLLRYFFYSVIALFVIIPTVIMWQPKGQIQEQEAYYSGIYDSTTDTGESSPIWSVRFMEKRPEAYASVINGDADIQMISRSTTVHKYLIQASEYSRIVENTLYFPGWNVYVNNQKTEIQFQDPAYRGLITYYVEEGENLVVIRFENTKIRFYAGIVSIISICILVFYFISVMLWRRK